MAKGSARKNLIETTNALGHPCLSDANGNLRPLSNEKYPFRFKMDDCYAGDLETTTQKQYEETGETRVWASGLMNIMHEDIKIFAPSIEALVGQFYEMAKLHAPYPCIIAYHNASFDFSFIENYLLKIGYNVVDDIRIRTLGTSCFSFLRNGMGQLYQVQIKIGVYESITLIDFAKIMPAKLADIGAALDIPKRKELIDYHKIRKVGYKITDNEMEYLWDDIIILAKAWRSVLETEGKLKLTRSGYAYESVKKEFEMNINSILQNTPGFDSGESYSPDVVDFKNFDKFFPAVEPWEFDRKKYMNEMYMNLNQEAYIKGTPEVTFGEVVSMMDAFSPNKVSMKNAYAGGKVFCHPKYVNKVINKRMVSIDAVSLYPSQWLKQWFPYGKGVYFSGEYQADHTHPKFIQRFKAEFVLKKGGFPSLPKKFGGKSREIYTHNDVVEDALTLCDVDLELFFDNYNVTKFESLDGIKYKQIYEPFSTFVKRFGDMKTKYGTKEHWNPILRFMSKLTLNGSYGKFGQSPFLDTNKSYLSETGVTKYTKEELTPDAMAYTPVAIWTTAYGRKALINLVRMIGVDKVLYDDTDSIKAFCDWESNDPDENFLLKPEIKDLLKSAKFMKENGTDFRSWEMECEIHHFKMLREKCYVMHSIHKMKNGQEVDEITIRAAGLTDDAKETITMYTDDDGRNLYYDERDGSKVWAYKSEIPQVDHKDMFYPVFRPWREVFDGFDFGVEYPKCLTKKQVNGGCILVDSSKILTEDSVITYERTTGEALPITDLYY